MNKMVTKLVLLLVVSILASEAVLTYYISPDPAAGETCIVNGNTALSPCYSIQELCEDKALMSNKTELVLLLLSGLHTILQGQILSVSDVQSLQISSWNEEQEVVVNCQMQSRLTFNNIGELRISFVNFSSCSIQNYSNRSRSWTRVTILISNCSFLESEENSAVVITIDFFFLKFTITVQHCVFSANKGGIVISDLASQFSRLSLSIADTIFQSNWRDADGGALYIKNVDAKLQRCSFAYNTATSGGAIFSDNSPLHISECTFNGNRATEGGNGGAISSLEFTYLQVMNTTFQENYSNGFGGAIFSSWVVRASNSSFIKNRAINSGGALFVLLRSTLKNTELQRNYFEDNLAEVSGGAIALKEGPTDWPRPDYGVMGTKVYDNTFKHNRAGIHGGAMYYRCRKRCHLNIYEKLDIIHNSARNGGAMYTVNVHIILSKALVTIANNSAEDSGGAMFLNSSSITSRDESHITFYQNRATAAASKGGAIFLLDTTCHSSCESLDIECLFHFESNSSLKFLSNSATYGSAVYGGLLDRCISRPGLVGIEYFKQITRNKPFPSDITSSDPIRICFCIGSRPLCDRRELHNITKMRGGTVTLSLSSVDQNANPQLSPIRAYYDEPLAEVDFREGRITVHGKCTTLSYHIFTPENSATLFLEPVGICERSPFSRLTVRIDLVPCSRGFQQSNDRCVCESRIVEHFGENTFCNIDTLSIERKGSLWVRYDEHQLKLHTSCPLDYCDITSDTISLSSPEQQCANHRSGVICGACQDNHSLALGNSKCLPCTSRYTFIWLLAVFAVAGVALVALLLVCNMTISTGTLNGLIFYANVVSISGLTSLHDCSLHPILSVFIAWLNLDLGVETCFYPGMDTYQKTWLQFVFPLYIWLLVAAIIVASYYSSRAMRVFGRNNIAILATLFLLSYSKILKTIVTALSVTEVLVGSADNTSSKLVPQKVWLHDGNVAYLEGKHMALFTVALLFLLFLFLPYTLLLLLGQCVRSMTVRRRGLLWIRSTAFISILDAYHAPYTRRHRYWTGLMLLTRCILFLAFTASYRENNLLMNMYITTLTVSGILIAKTVVTKIYKNFYLGLLELCFLVNLEVLSATLYYLKGRNSSYSSICRCTNTSISCSLLLFVGILAYHACLQISKRKWYVSIRDTLLEKLGHHDINCADEDTVSPNTVSERNITLPTTTSLQQREVLLLQ